MRGTADAGVLAGIGGTPLVEVRKIVPSGSARLLAKLELANPTGSMKDRMAAAVIAGAEAGGDLVPGCTVVDYTAGTTGISLAFVCAAKGYGFHAVFSDAFSNDRRHTMEAFGATVEDVPSDHGRITEQLIKAMIARAGVVSQRPGHWWCDQLNNDDAMSGYGPLGDEIAAQAAGRVDVFVQAVATAHSIHGVARALRAHCGAAGHRRRTRRVCRAVWRAQWRTPDRRNRDRVHPAAVARGRGRSDRDGHDRRSDDDEPAAGPGGSDLCRHVSGANVVAALRVAERLGRDATVVTVVVDSGLRYLSTDLYRG